MKDNERNVYINSYSKYLSELERKRFEETEASDIDTEIIKDKTKEEEHK